MRMRKLKFCWTTTYRVNVVRVHPADHHHTVVVGRPALRAHPPGLAVLKLRDGAAVPDERLVCKCPTTDPIKSP